MCQAMAGGLAGAAAANQYLDQQQMNREAISAYNYRTYMEAQPKTYNVNVNANVNQTDTVYWHNY